MKFSFASALLVSLAAESVVASNWFTKAAYNKWNENELERWLSDHDVPYPTPADRKDLENLVKTNWDAALESPYVNWDTNQLQKYLAAQGQEIKKGTEKNKDSLVSQVKSSWTETESQAANAYNDVKTWIFDSWTESSLKSFCDKHGIPVPQPRTRDVLLKTARENYHATAEKLKEVSSYPGNWLYDSWSDSDLKSWLDERGIPVPQTGARDKMIAAVRRNSYIASRQAQAYASSASASAHSAQQSLSDALISSWGETQLKEWADKNGVKVPQGSNKNELQALVRKHMAKLTGGNVSASAASAYGAATSSAGNQYAQVTDKAAVEGNALVNQVYSNVMGYVDEAMILLGLKTNYASSASSYMAGGGYASSASKSAASAASVLSKSASSAASSASSRASKSAQSAKNEL